MCYLVGKLRARRVPLRRRFFQLRPVARTYMYQYSRSAWVFQTVVQKSLTEYFWNRIHACAHLILYKKFNIKYCAIVLPAPPCIIYGRFLLAVPENSRDAVAAYACGSHTKIAPLVTKITYIKMDPRRCIRNGFASGGYSSTVM